MLKAYKMRIASLKFSVMENRIWIALGLLSVLSLTWQVYGQVNCTATGVGRFAEPSDTTCKNYTYCVLNPNTGAYLSYSYACPSTSLFNPNTAQCTTSYTCTATTTVAPSVCTADGYIANPSVTNCSSYIECVLIDNSFIETTYDCPDNTFFNPNTTLCEYDYNCTTTVAFSCTASGRYANSADTTCQTYYLCVLATNGTYSQYTYTCPSTSVFSPTARVCTTAYTCPG